MQDYVPSDGEYVTGWQSEHEAYPFRISARDLARFALLYLRKGQWNERQIVSENWVAESTKTHSEGKRDHGYGYMWWTGDSGFRSVGIKGPVFLATGYRRQYAFVFPERDLVIVHRINSDTTKPIPHRRQVAHLIWLIFSRIRGHVADAEPGHRRCERQEIVRQRDFGPVSQHLCIRQELTDR